jgi:hypothetical protein
MWYLVERETLRVSLFPFLAARWTINELAAIEHYPVMDNI